jgi:hypothetical protein
MNPIQRKVIALLIAILSLFSPDIHAQFTDNFSDGDFTANPAWQGDTPQFQITSSSAIPPELKPALQLNAEGSDTSILLLPNTSMLNTEWRFWVKLSFNTSANNFARVYLVSSHQNLKGALNGYFIQVGGSEDSIALYRQTGFQLEKIIAGTIAYTGNSTNILRIKVTHDNQHQWNLYSAAGGGFDYVNEGTATDNTISSTAFFGIYCKYTSSNSTKFYFDDFYVNEIIIDTLPPEIVSLQAISETQLELNLSEPVEINSSQNILNYFVNTIGNPATAALDPANFSLVHLTFLQHFIPGVNYTLTVNNVADLSGNLMENEQATFQFQPPAVINPFDIVINEIMTDFNPPPSGLPEADYLELYNRTDHAITLENCSVKPRESSNPIIFPAVSIEPESFLLVVQTSDVPSFEEFGPVIGLPGFSMNNEGAIVLRNPYGSLICSISYTDDWYKDDVKKAGGWSLEQIDPQHPCTGSANWAASNHLSGGTPGSQNSVNGNNPSLPELQSLEISGANTVSVNFSHFMDSLSVLNKLAYAINQGIGTPSNVTVVNGEFTIVTLTFSSEFLENLNYTLTITDTIYNCSGDFIPLNSVYELIMPSEAEIYDIVINELLPDPDPPIGLPEFEFIELYNTTASYLKMMGWSLMVGTSVKSIPPLVISPHEFLIFTEEEAVNLYGMLARSIGFSSLGLSNTGTSVKLINENNEIVSSVSYTDSWYNDATKAEGGWSLEQVDPENPCPGKENWTASLDQRGGSPGTENSVNSFNPVNPLVTKVISIDTLTFEITFNQLMDQQSILNPAAYNVDQGIGNPVNASLVSSDLNKVLLTFSQPFVQGILYTLTLTTNIQSCIGQPVPADFTIQFGIPENPLPSDIVINEVLFNPADDGVDFVEIYNRSPKIFDLKNLQLGTLEINQFEPTDTILKSVSSESALLLSGQYLVLTKDPVTVKNQYATQNPEGFITMSAFPAYNNDAGTVVLMSAGGSLLDAFTYSESMHVPLLNSFDGVSLERINYDRPSSDFTNWHSASENCGFASPAYQNSQYCQSANSTDAVTLEPEIFSPDNDGYNDVVNISYNFGTPGYSCSITIFDAQGRLVTQIVNNEMLGTQGTYSWDGQTDAGQKATIGIYVVYFEAFDMNGNIKKYKKPVVLAGKL